MRDSETYNRSATIGTAENRNRKTVVRIQSTKKIYCVPKICDKS